MTSLIVGRSEKFAELYSAERWVNHAPASYVKENYRGSKFYLDWLEPPNSQDLEGIHFRQGLKPLACLKGSAPQDCKSAVCPHLGGIVHWNELERTWDCPVHGSRFDRFGEVLFGPANGPLRESS